MEISILSLSYNETPKILIRVIKSNLDVEIHQITYPVKEISKNCENQGFDEVDSSSDLNSLYDDLVKRILNTSAKIFCFESGREFLKSISFSYLSTINILPGDGYY